MQRLSSLCNFPIYHGGTTLEDVNHMSGLLQKIIVILTGYLLGSLPFSYLVTKLLTGKDLRHVGNGNVGTRNTIRVAGRPEGMLALLLDAGKGAAAYIIAHHWGDDELTLYLSGIALLLGHWFPIWLGGRGGIGQAAVTGFAAAMWPLGTLLALPVFMVARVTLFSFIPAYVIAAALFLVLSLWKGESPYTIAHLVALLAAVGVKKLLDTPRQDALLATQEGEDGPDTFFP